MKINSSKKITSLLLCMMLIVATAFMTTGCNTDKQDGKEQSSTQTKDEKEHPQTQEKDDKESTQDSQDGKDNESTQDSQNNENKDNVLGEGKTKLNVTVVDKEGNEANFEVYTDKETVGAALLQVGLIEGEESQYGLFIKKVNGITADYDVDKTYWAFYVDGEYAMAGADSTKIEEGVTYTFKVEK